MIHSTTRTNPENTVLGERSQSHTYCVIQFIEMFRTGESRETKGG